MQWTNRETEIVNDWMERDEARNAYAIDAARDYYFDHDEDREAAAEGLADCLEAEAKETAGDLDVPDMFFKLLEASLAKVNWREIAAHWIAKIG